MYDINTHEYTFSVNEFGEPVVLKDSEAIAMYLTHLLLLDPGTIQSHPSMGVGLVSKYRYTMEDKISSLRDDFRDQIAKYLPQFQAVEVNCSMQEKICFINAKIDGVLYGFYYDSDNNKLHSSFKKLTDL